MTKGIKILIAVAVVLVVAAAVFLLVPKKNPGTTNNQPADNSQTNEQEADVIISYDGSSFTLSAASVKSGGTVKVINNSSKDLDFASDPHPVHTENSELNAGDIAPGKSALFTLTTKGTWGFHNHLNASQKGELTVE